MLIDFRNFFARHLFEVGIRLKQAINHFTEELKTTEISFVKAR